MLAAGGPIIPFQVIDGDAEDPDADALPSTSGRLRVDIADLSRTFESGSGVLARIVLTRTESDLAETWSNLHLEEVRLLDGSQSGREYAIETIGSAQVTFGGSCP
jgi:hypothetical protein